MHLSLQSYRLTLVKSRRGNHLFPHLLYLRVITNNQRLILRVAHDDNEFVIANLPKAGVAITFIYTHNLCLCILNLYLICIPIFPFIFCISAPAVNSSPIFFSSLRGAKRRGNLIHLYPHLLHLYLLLQGML